MSNENVRTTSTSASISSNYTANISTISATPSLASISSSSLSSPVSSSLPVSSFIASTSHFDATVNAIAAAVNASTNLPVTPPDAAVVVAVAVSSLAAAIIPDTPIVSIAGLTLSEITTTTTSTRTTPTPVPTTKNPIKKENLKSKSSDSLQTLKPSSSASVKQPHHQMSVANLSVEGAITNASCQAENAAADNDIQSNSSTTAKTATTKHPDSSSGALKSTTEAATSPAQSLAVNPNASSTKCDANNDSPNENKSKDTLSDSWEERRLNDWDDNKLKELLDEAYSYKNPRDKENKSKTFLQLLEKVQNDDQSYKFRARGSRNLSNSITSNNYHHYQNPHYHSHSHNNNRSHHHHKQGGSLQDLFEIGLHETQLDCDQSFGSGIGGNQRTRRQNHNSRQKKFSSSVSSRQREGGSLPSNVNVTHQLTGSIGNELGFMQQEVASSASCKASKKEQRRNAAKTASVGTAVSLPLESKESSISSTAADTTPTKTQTPIDNQVSTDTNAATSSLLARGAGDFIIDMGEPIIDIQQQQKILESKGQDTTKQGQSFYERLVSIDKRIPRVNLIGSAKSTYFAPTTSHCYVDETVRFDTLEDNVGSNSNVPNATVDAKFLPLDENYKACKSVLGGEGEKWIELGKQKANSIYTKITAAGSGSPSLGGTLNNIATITQRQLDENGNALSDIYHNSSSVGGAAVTGTTMQINCVSPTTANPASAGILLTSSGGNNVSTSATVTIPPHPTSNTVSTSATITAYAAGPSQAKAKTKKKSQQERNTKTVDVESVAGYRGKDPVEELVKYIESSGEGGSSKSGDKKKERKKDKEKHQKLKKSNSLEELRSGAKMEVHELKRTAATTESNAVVLRQKAATSGGKQNKNNSSSTADINKNLENKPTNPNSRKSDRRSWGNEDLKYLGDQQNANTTSIANEEKSVAGTTATNIPASSFSKDRKNIKGAGTTIANKDDKEIKDRTAERNERNMTNSSVLNYSGIQQQHLNEKLEKQDKQEKPEKSERRKRYDTPPNAVTIIDIVPMESSCPETAEFHVVTKKKKPKKPKVITNSEETSVTFNRTHNFTIQKSTQSIPRYKYHQHDGNNLSGNHQVLHNNSNLIGGVVGGNVVSNNYSPSSSTSQQQYQHNTETYNNSDKSRRKSTSSVPPSEKSDSSDLDSVHSLPIESTKANATKDSSQAKMRGPKTGIPSLAQNKNNSQAPISYADIARTNKEIADAAAAFSVIDAASFDTKSPDACVIDEKSCSDDKLIAASSVANVLKIQKLKKSQVKQDFPELVNPVSVIVSANNSQTVFTATNATQSQTGSLINDAATPTPQPDVLTKISSLTHDQNHPPQTLQKSKSVENDSTTSNTSTSSYMVPLNSNSLDQQYPALEKTVKRHSSANIGANYMTTNQQTSSAFNFAAAAKQQISTNNTEPSPNVNCSKNSALTTSTNTNIQTAASGGANNVTINSITTTNTNNNINSSNRKSKEKSPPIHNTQQNTTQDIMNSKKSKKDRQQLQQYIDGSNASQSKMSSSSYVSRKPFRSQLKSSSSLPHTTSTQTIPRPAVIILNDDRNSSGCAADNQFTFGDFNEDELKLFEDDVSGGNYNCADCNVISVIDNHELSDDQKDSCDVGGGSLQSPGAMYFNDSGASCENDIVNNSVSDLLLNSSIDASSPNTSFANINHTSRGSCATRHMSAPGNNQSSDSGIYTDRAKPSFSSQIAVSGQESKQTSPVKDDDNKLNTFLSNTKCASAHTSMDSLDPPPQQLETCNEIETAIIAAARAAAKHQQHNTTQQQKFKNSNCSSNSSSFSSSSFSSNNTAAMPYHSSNCQTLNQHVISCGSNNISNHQPPNQPQQQDMQLYDLADNDESFDNSQRSRSPSRPRRISIQFIPPTMATALTTQQHNEIIVDFIGSAWEEIANSKVTKVYDGQ